METLKKTVTFSRYKFLRWIPIVIGQYLLFITTIKLSQRVSYVKCDWKASQSDDIKRLLFNYFLHFNHSKIEYFIVYIRHVKLAAPSLVLCSPNRNFHCAAIQLFIFFLYFSLKFCIKSPIFSTKNIFWQYKVIFNL